MTEVMAVGEIQRRQHSIATGQEYCILYGWIVDNDDQLILEISTVGFPVAWFDIFGESTTKDEMDVLLICDLRILTDNIRCEHLAILIDELFLSGSVAGLTKFVESVKREILVSLCIRIECIGYRLCPMDGINFGFTVFFAASKDSCDRH